MNEIEPLWIITTVLLTVIAGTTGYFIARSRERDKAHNLEIELARKETRLTETHQHHKQQIETLQSAREALTGQFATLSRSALQINSRQFLRLAEQQFKQHHQSNESHSEGRHKAINDMISPLNKTIEKTREQLKNIEKDHHASYTSLNHQIRSLASSEADLQQETRNLVNALKRTDVRGRWGEISLKRIAELSGMINYCDFIEQSVVETDNGAIFRPDMIIRMPGKKELIVDAKAPLNGFLTALESDSENDKKIALKQHAKNFRKQVKLLSAKAYWQQFSTSPDFVIMFIPGDQFLSSALEQDNDLLEDAIKCRVILATPSTLIALLRSVAYGWKQQDLTENAEKIRDQGEEIITRIATLTEHFAKLGKSLNQSVNSYNSTLGSLERQLIPSARRMSDLGVSSRKEPVTSANITIQAKQDKQAD